MIVICAGHFGCHVVLRKARVNKQMEINEHLARIERFDDRFIFFL